MIPKRNGYDNELESNGRAVDATPVVSQAMRAAEEAGAAKQEKKDDEKMSLFWRVFGGTIISIVALVAVTLFNNLTNSISELRSEVTRANEARATAISDLRAELARNGEARADFVKKDEFASRTTNIWDRVQGLQTQNTSQNATLTSLKTEIDGLKERLARAGMDSDAVKKDLAGLEVLKERLTLLVADLKGTRDDIQKLRADVDKNQANDTERKERRDALQKQTEETLKELTKGMQDCREKMARLEGMSNSPTFVGPPAPSSGMKK